MEVNPRTDDGQGSSFSRKHHPCDPNFAEMEGLGTIYDPIVMLGDDAWNIRHP